MAIHRLLPLAGKLSSVVYRIPMVGEGLVRASARLAGTLAFKTPILGGTPSNHIGQVRDQWLRFLGMVGLKPRVVSVTDGAFEMELDACPYGFSKPEDADLCDACMDLDRMFVHHLKGRLEILDRLPQGSPCCRFRLSFR